MAVLDFLVETQRRLPLRGGTLQQLGIVALLRDSPRSIQAWPGTSVNWVAAQLQSSPESIRNSIKVLRTNNAVYLVGRADRTQLFSLTDEAREKFEYCLGLIPEVSAVSVVPKVGNAHGHSKIRGAV